jgi:hypothetical protein
MNYEMRMEMVRGWLKKEMLPRFSAPSSVDKGVALQDVAEAVNANLPRVDSGERFTHYLTGVAKHVVQHARGRTLPTPKDFIDACREVTKAKAVGVSFKQATKFCPYKITEQRVKAGEAISSTWLTDRMLDDLIANTNLTMEDMMPYVVAHKQSGETQDHEQNGIHRW